MFFFFGVCVCLKVRNCYFFVSVSGVGLSSSPGDSEIFLPFLDTWEERERSGKYSWKGKKNTKGVFKRYMEVFLSEISGCL